MRLFQLTFEPQTVFGFMKKLFWVKLYPKKWT